MGILDSIKGCRLLESAHVKSLQNEWQIFLTTNLINVPDSTMDNLID